MLITTFAATVLAVMLLGFAPSHALTVQFFKCGTSSCSSLTQLGSNLGGSSTSGPINIANTSGYGGKLVINNLSSTSLAKVELAQTSSVKNIKLSNALIKATEAGTYLIRMKSDARYSPQPGGKNYVNSVALNGGWVGSGSFTNNTIKVVLTANFGQPDQTSVDQPPASPTVVVQYAADGKTFSRSANTKSESIFLASDGLTCTDPSTNTSITTCGRNFHQKDLRITYTAANQVVNMGESSIGVASESEIRQGGRAEVNRFLLCGETSAQFQAGTTSVERNYLMSPHAPLSTNPDRPNNAPPNFKIQFDAALAPRDGTETLVSILSDNPGDTSNDSQFNLFLPCLTSTPVTFGGISNLTAVFPTNAFTVDNMPSDACKGTLRWVINLVDKKGVNRVVQVLYGDVEQSFDNCESFSDGNMITTGDARFLFDGDLKRRNQLNSLNDFVVTSIKLLLDGSLAVGFPANQSSAIDITVALTSMQVNNDAPILFASQSPTPVCPPEGPDHGFGILITRIDPPVPAFSNLIPQSRISTGGCKVSVNADTATDFGGAGTYMIEALNNATPLDNAGFIMLGP